MRRGRVLDQAGRQVLVQGGLHFLGHDGIDAERPGLDRSASFRDRNHEGHQRAGTKIRLGLLENVRKFAENFPQLFDGLRGPARAVNQKPPLADVVANVPRPAGTKRAVLGSNDQTVQARARLGLRGGKL